MESVGVLRGQNTSVSHKHQLQYCVDVDGRNPMRSYLCQHKTVIVFLVLIVWKVR